MPLLPLTVITAVKELVLSDQAPSSEVLGVVVTPLSSPGTLMMQLLNANMITAISAIALIALSFAIAKLTAFVFWFFIKTLLKIIYNS
jgi:hypothetical protein